MPNCIWHLAPFIASLLCRCRCSSMNIFRIGCRGVFSPLYSASYVFMKHTTDFSRCHVNQIIAIRRCDCRGHACNTIHQACRFLMMPRISVNSWTKWATSISTRHTQTEISMNGLISQ